MATMSIWYRNTKQFSMETDGDVTLTQKELMYLMLEYKYSGYAHSFTHYMQVEDFFLTTLRREENKTYLYKFLLHVFIYTTSIETHHTLTVLYICITTNMNSSNKDSHIRNIETKTQTSTRETFPRFQTSVKKSGQIRSHSKQLRLDQAKSVQIISHQ